MTEGWGKLHQHIVQALGYLGRTDVLGKNAKTNTQEVFRAIKGGDYEKERTFVIAPTREFISTVMSIITLELMSTTIAVLKPDQTMKQRVEYLETNMIPKPKQQCPQELDSEVLEKQKHWSLKSSQTWDCIGFLSRCRLQFEQQQTKKAGIFDECSPFAKSKISIDDSISDVDGNGKTLLLSGGLLTGGIKIGFPRVPEPTASDDGEFADMDDDEIATSWMG